MSQLRDGLRQLIAQPEHPTTQVRPVSRISFSITDTDGFKKSAQFAVDWLANKVGGDLPKEASSLASFDTRGVAGFHPCHAVRLDDHSGSIWAARIDEPGSIPRAGETWSTELFVERPVRGLVRFGAQLMVRCPAGSADLRGSRPRLVYDLLRTLSAEVDGEAISDAAIDLTTRDDAARLADLIYRPGRRLPIIVVSTDYDGRAQLNLHHLGVRLSGAAHLYSAKPEMSWELTRLIGKRMSTFNGGVRIYMPGLVEEEEDPYEHPLWLLPPSGVNTHLINQLAERILPLGFQDNEGETRFWHMGQLRKATSATAALEASSSETEQLRAKVSVLQDEVEDLKEQLEIAVGLERIASSAEKGAQQDVQRMQDEISRLKSENYRLRNLPGSGDRTEPANGQDRALENYDDLKDWAEEVLGPHIYIHTKALKECCKNGHPDMIDRIADTLIAIRDFWIPFKLEGGLAKKEAAENALAALGVENEGCFTRREKAAEKSEYSVRDGSITRVLYDHFKYGNSRQNSEQFRIYYSWDEDGRRLIIGKMPSHLPNDLS
ncbi:hypothetical protein HGO34_17410 [Agrobacterium vitis]|uniref:Uncharacterized protein n=1 Tax=Agrobacterium vitis TaxID=373 RepID=A0AAE5AWI1_AGRVI|nr:hypothetical protein [Agrobacterium vitis]MCF1497607.1 hypothetical protein [Allorhizobium sp. Av2]MCM2441504.1 hypothetical protein [Agrobacterium vitis]MUZ59408.1 hypothetical protein [Agrobacterium vitis]MVA67927.1 hypothetical protein [Agrobacterium vitis]MVA89711.1 hypothetical protein [Agrobacterium vitis]